jgi:hypothetical protein
MSLREHVTCLLYRVSSLCFRVDSWCTIFAVIKVDTNLALIINLIGIDIWHLHLLCIYGLICWPVIFLEMLGHAKLFAPACMCLLSDSLESYVHVNVRVVIGRSDTNCIFSVRKKAEGSFFILTMSLKILTVINLCILKSTADSHATKRHLLGVNLRHFNWHWCYFVSNILNRTCWWIGVLVSCVPRLHSWFWPLIDYRIIGEMWRSAASWSRRRLIRSYIISSWLRTQKLTIIF